MNIVSYTMPLFVIITSSTMIGCNSEGSASRCLKPNSYAIMYKNRIMELPSGIEVQIIDGDVDIIKEVCLNSKRLDIDKYIIALRQKFSNGINSYKINGLKNLNIYLSTNHRFRDINYLPVSNREWTFAQRDITDTGRNYTVKIHQGDQGSPYSVIQCFIWDDVVSKGSINHTCTFSFLSRGGIEVDLQFVYTSTDSSHNDSIENTRIITNAVEKLLTF